MKDAPIAILEVSFDGSKLRNANSIVGKLTHYSKAELLALNPLEDILVKESKDKFQEIIKEVLAGKKNIYSELKIKTKNGQILSALFNGEVIFKDDKPDSIIVFAQDITELKKTEEALQSSKEKFSKAFRFSPNAVTITRLSDGKIIDANESVSDILGFTPLEAIGRTTSELRIWVNPSDRLSLVKELSLKGFVRNKDFVLRKKDGTQITVTASASSIKIQGEDCFLSSFIDVTERKKMEEELKSSEIRFRSIYENSLDAVMLTIPDGTILSANPAAQRMLGMTEDEIKSSGRNGIVVMNDRAVAAIKERKKVGYAQAELTFKRKDGSIFEAEVSSGLFSDADGVTKTSMIIRDITERKKAEEAIRESEQLYRTLFDNSDDAFVLLEPLYDQNGRLSDFRFLKVNRAYERQTGAGPATIEGKRASEDAVDLEPELFSLIDRVVKTGEWARYESFDWHTNRCYDSHIFPFAKGQVGVLLRDITERKKAEEALKESESKYQLLVERLPEMVFEINDIGTIVFANSATVEQMGYSKQELENGFDAIRLVAKEDVKRSRKNMKKMFTVGKRQRNEYIFVRNNGSQFPVLLVSAPIIKEDKIVGARGVGIDMTELKQAQQALQENERRYHQLFDSMAEVFFILGLVYDKKGVIADFVFIDANFALLKLLKKQKEDVIGKSPRELLKDIRQKETLNMKEDYWLKTINKIEETGQPVRSLLKSEILNRYFEFTAWKPSKNQIGVIAEDVTERRLLEKQLQEKERLSAIGETAGMVGHDLRNPLQAIIGELYIAKSELGEMPHGQPRTAMHESIESLETQVSYMDKIVSDLQTFVKPVETNKQKVKLNELFVSTLAQIDVPKNIEARIEPKDKLTVLADPQLLRRVLINLITNSIQAMPDGGELIIRAYVNGKGRMKIEVEDTGVGIPKEIKSKIFTPLFTTKSRGQGFGLSVCKRVIEAQGGTISFKSEVGKGTKFTITLPLK